MLIYFVDVRRDFRAKQEIPLSLRHAAHVLRALRVARFLCSPPKLRFPLGRVSPLALGSLSWSVDSKQQGEMYLSPTPDSKLN